MERGNIILIVDDDDAVGEVIAAIARRELPGAEVLLARTGLAALELFCTHRRAVCLVILDIQLVGAWSGREVCLKIRELDQAVPILPCTVDLQSAPFLDDLGCAPLVTKQALVMSQSSFADQLQRALQAPARLRISQASLSYMLRQADALLEDAEAGSLSRAIVLCHHPLVRTALDRALESLGVHVLASVENIFGLHRVASRLARAQVVVGSLGDLDDLPAAAALLCGPALAIALEAKELEALPEPPPRDVSLVLFEEAGDVTLLLRALDALLRKQRFLALPVEVVARWVPPPAGLSLRAWEVVLASLVRPTPAEVGMACGVDPDTVETYWKRARRWLGRPDRQAILAEARAAVLQRLTVMPEIVAPSLRQRELGG